MKVIHNRANEPKKDWTVWCTHCRSELRITDADIQRVEGRSAVLCPCCRSHFPAMTEAETVTAYYNK